MAEQPQEQNGEQTRTFGLGALIGSVVVALVIAGVAGYFIGHGVGESSGKDEGLAEGRIQGAQVANARYRPGTENYRLIYDAGKTKGLREGAAAGLRRGAQRGKRTGLREGEQVGFQQGETAGEKQGEATGEQEGIPEGASDVLGGFSDWSAGALYVISMEAGEDVPYTIAQRHQMQPDFNYRLCTSNPQKLCEAVRE